jgi:uncharacterized protein
MSEQANVDLILSVYDAFRRGEIATILNQLDPQVEWNNEGPATIPFAGIHHGREGAAKFFKAIGETMDEVSLHMEPFAAQGDNVVTSGRYQARIKPTGKRIDVPLVHLWTIRNGMVVRYQNLTDTAATAAAYTSVAATAR